MKYRCKHCGYIYSYPLDNITNCQMCNNSKKDIVEWDDKEGFIKKEKLKKRVWISDLNPSIARIDERCIDCGICQKICSKVTNISYDKQLAENPICINCGQCILNCPTKALVPKYNYKKILNYLNDTSYFVTVSVAPAVRVAIGDLFGYDKGAFLEKKLVGALKQLKFTKVFDLTFGADMTIMEESKELLERLILQKNLPMFTSCCPSWVKYCEMFHHKLLDNLSTTKSPISIQGALINTYYKDLNNLDSNKIINVMVAPCVAKKYEIKRPELFGMDYVITTEELALMLKESNIDLKTVEEQDFDELIGHGSTSGLIFGTSGGVMEATLRTAYYLYTNEKAPHDFYNLQEIRGIKGIKEAEIKIANLNFKVAVVNGLINLEKILTIQNDYAFIEVMNCPGGCIGGGGQPLIAVSQAPEYNERRQQSLYEEDAKSTCKDSYDNQNVINIYKTYLKYPNSKESKALLHTKYFKKQP